MRTLHLFNHGLGDCMQFTSVIKHIKKYNPKAILDVVVSGRGKKSCFTGLADNVFSFGGEYKNIKYDSITEYSWPEVYTSYPDYPSTKTVKCIAEQLKLVIDNELLYYTINISDAAKAKVDKYLSTINIDKGFVCIHYEGNTDTSNKNLSYPLIKDVCEKIIAIGYTPIIMDWDDRTSVDQKRIYNPDKRNPLWGGLGTGDAEILAALFSKAALVIAIDSGPLHVAMATETPVFGVWTKHHPIHFVDFSKNAVHFIPANHHDYVRGGRKEAAIKYFYDKYKYIYYNDLKDTLIENINLFFNNKDEFMNKVPVRKFSSADYNKVLVKNLSSTAYNEVYYQEHKKAGLDYLNYGDWQGNYGKWLVESFNLSGKKILDVGCACGSIANGLQKAGAIVYGIDLNEHTIAIGRQKFKNINLNICDAANMHIYSDEIFDFVHINQAAEHWRPELVPFILKEIHRVLSPNGIVLNILDTQELYDRQKRDPKKEDPTHLCIKPMSWWKEIITGFELISNEKLVNHHLSYLKKYDWDYFICRKV